MKRIFFLPIIGLLIFSSTPTHAQDEVSAVKAVIETMFDSMREADSAKLHTVFIDEVKMQTIQQNRSGEMVLRDGTLERFLTSVGTPHEKVYDEQILDYQIKVDGAMASAWTPYKFFLGEDFSHCGVNSFQLMKTAEGWKIIYLVDTRRREGCQ